MADLLSVISDRLGAWRPPSEDIKAAGAAVARRRFREGWLTGPQIRDELTWLGYDDREIAVQERVAALEFGLDTLTDALGSIVAAFAKGRISPDRFLEDLATLGMDPGRARQHLEREQLRRSRKAEEITPAQTLRAYSRQLLTDTQARLRLQEAGYAAQDIVLLLALATVEPEAEARRLGPAQVLKAYAAGILTRDQAVQRLRDALYPSQDIDLLLTLAVLEPDTPVRGLTAAQTIQAYRDKLITDQDLQRRLAALGYPPEDAWLLVQIATKPPTELELRQLPVATVISAFKAGLLTGVQATARLLAQRYSPADASLILDLAARPKAEISRRDLTPAQLVKLYQAGLLDAPTLVDRLLALDYTVADARLLATLALEELDPRQLRDLTPAQLLSLLVADLLGQAQVLDRLLALNYSVEDAQLLIAQALTA